MKKKTVTGLLVLSLAAMQPQSNAKTYRPYNAVPLACALLVIGVGVVVVIQLKKLCDKIPPVDPPQTNTTPPVPTNNIPTNNIPTNPPTTKPWYHIWSLNDANVTYTESASTPGQAYTAWKLQVSGSLKGPWITLYSVQSWTDWSGTVTQWTDSKGSVVWVSHCDPNSYDNIPLDIGSVNDPQKFYRITQ